MVFWKNIIVVFIHYCNTYDSLFSQTTSPAPNLAICAKSCGNRVSVVNFYKNLSWHSWHTWHTLLPAVILLCCQLCQPCQLCHVIFCMRHLRFLRHFVLFVLIVTPQATVSSVSTVSHQKFVVTNLTMLTKFCQLVKLVNFVMSFFQSVESVVSTICRTRALVVRYIFLICSLIITRPIPDVLIVSNKGVINVVLHGVLFSARISLQSYEKFSTFANYIHSLLSH